MSIAQSHQRRRRGEIKIGTVRVWTIPLVGQVAGAIPGIARGELLRPQNASARYLYRDYGIAKGRGWIGIIVAGRDIHDVVSGVECRSRPHPYTRWTGDCRTALCLR